MSQTESLVIKIKSLKQAGDYECHGDNGVDDELMKVVSLVINGKMFCYLNYEKCAFKSESLEQQNVELKSVIFKPKQRHCEVQNDESIVLVIFYLFYHKYLHCSRYDFKLNIK